MIKMYLGAAKSRAEDGNVVMGAHCSWGRPRDDEHVPWRSWATWMNMVHFHSRHGYAETEVHAVGYSPSYTRTLVFAPGFLFWLWDQNLRKAMWLPKWNWHRILVQLPHPHPLPVFPCFLSSHHENCEIATVYLIEWKTKLMPAHFFLNIFEM